MPLLASLEHSFLRRFEGSFTVPPFNRCRESEHLERLLSANPPLEHFRVHFRAFRSLPHLMQQVVQSCIRGLVSNRNLRSIDFAHFALATDDGRWASADEFKETGDDAAVTVDDQLREEILRVLRAHNTSLRRIDGLSYESEAQEERIESLLTQRVRSGLRIERAPSADGALVGRAGPHQ
jgi:hypothetical protein